MTIDWKRLVEVREQHERTARQRFVHEQQACDESHARAMAAAQHLQQQHAYKAELWQQTSSSLAGGACSVASLRNAGAWSGALDAQIAQAQQRALETQQALDQQQIALEAARQRLRSAAADTHKAREMQQRAIKLRLREQDGRVERTVEEAAAHAWAAAQRAA